MTRRQAAPRPVQINRRFPRAPPLRRNKAPVVAVRGRPGRPAFKGKSPTTPAVRAPFNWKSQLILPKKGPSRGSGGGGSTLPFAVGPRTVKRRGPDLF
jgi:hypothetical protein